jgi:hypothetical protein
MGCGYINAMNLFPPARGLPRTFLVVALTAGLLFSAGCSSSRESIVPPELAKKCVMVSGDTAGFGWAAWTARHMPDAPRYSVARLDEAIRRCQQTDAALILADELLPPDAERELPALVSYLEAGGRLVWLGWKPSSTRTGYSFTSNTLRVKGTVNLTAIPATLTASPHPPPRGSGGASAGEGRWIPVITAMSPQGHEAGWPGWVALEPRRSGTHAVIAALSLPPLAAEPELSSDLLEAVLAEATREVYLLRYGMDRYAAPAHQSMQAGALILDRRRSAREPLRLIARWLNPDGLEIRRHVTPPLNAPFAWQRLDAGLAPEPPGRASALYRVELEIRDRNDQTTLDSASQVIKVFPPEVPAVMKPVIADRGLLLHDRVPLFMLGVQYWPRIAAPVPDAPSRAHWLDPAWFRPEVVSSDLDLMAANGVNAISIEYTDPAQAPQLLYVLDELRRRAMWASVYMPSLHPLDPRLEAALNMLEAIRPAAWPEMFALETCRGITLRSRDDLRRLDRAWADWLEEHHGSAAAAAQKIGVDLWRERGEIAGPPEDVLRSSNPGQHRGLGLYYNFLHDIISRRTGHTRRVLRANGHELLLTARSAYAAPPGAPPVLDALDISAGVLHLDFLLADAWALNPLDDVTDDVPAMSAYLQAVGGGRPVIWCAFGQPLDVEASLESMMRQQEVYAHQFNSFLDHHAGGTFAWRFASDPDGREDWGMMNPDGTWRPVGDALREARFELRRWRPERPRSIAARAVPWYLSASQWRVAREQRTGIFAEDHPPGLLQLPGEGLDTFALIQQTDRDTGWSIADGHRMLNAEWGRIDAGAQQEPGSPGEPVRTYTGRALRLELLNTGTVAWQNREQNVPGSVRVRITQPGAAGQWLPVQSAGRGVSQMIAWTPSGQGVWELQPYLNGYGAFGQRLRVEATAPPPIY